MSPIIAANWKMNLTQPEASALIQSINLTMDGLSNVELIICPSHCYLGLAHSELAKGQIAAQNISEYAKGAYTGEISAEIAKSCGATYALLGHSERRHVFHETNDMIRQKLALCDQVGLTPIEVYSSPIPRTNPEIMRPPVTTSSIATSSATLRG